MSTHYDVEGAVEGFLAEMRKMKPGPDTVAPNVIQMRSHALRAELLRYMLTENNRGSHIADIVGAAGDMVAEFLLNVMIPFDTATQSDICRIFSMRLNGSLAKGFIKIHEGRAPSAKIPRTEGGHA